MPVSFAVQNVANVGGSHSDTFDSDNRYGYFQKGVETLRPKASKVYRVRILPARDPSFSANDPAGLTSFSPYRDKTSVDKENGQPLFTNWYMYVAGYNWMGRGNGSFMSPATLRRLGLPDYDDPVQDMRAHCKKNSQWEQFLKLETGTGKNTKLVVPKLKYSALMNVLAFDERTQHPEKVRIMEISSTSLDDLKRKMNMPRSVGSPEITPAWSKYMVGDPTDPMTGLLAAVHGGIPEGSTLQQDTSLVSFSTLPYELKDHSSYPIDPNTPTGQAMLKARYDLFSDKTLKIWSYQEIVDWVTADGMIPYELIQEACSHKANIPARPAQASTFSTAPAQAAAPAWGGKAGAAPAASWGGQPAAPAVWGQPAAPTTPAAPAKDDDDVPSDFLASVPAAPQAPVAPTPPASPAPPVVAPVVQAPEVKFWLANNGQATLITKTEVQNFIEAGYDGVLMSEDQKSGWQPISFFGFTARVAPVVVPSSPRVQAAPQAPAAPAVEAPKVANALPEAPSNLTPEETARLVEISKMIADKKHTPDVMKEYVALMTRKAKKA